MKLPSLFNFYNNKPVQTASVSNPIVNTVKNSDVNKTTITSQGDNKKQDLQKMKDELFASSKPSTSKANHVNSRLNENNRARHFSSANKKMTQYKRPTPKLRPKAICNFADLVFHNLKAEIDPLNEPEIIEDYCCRLKSLRGISTNSQQGVIHASKDPWIMVCRRKSGAIEEIDLDVNQSFWVSKQDQDPVIDIDFYDDLR